MESTAGIGGRACPTIPCAAPGHLGLSFDAYDNEMTTIPPHTKEILAGRAAEDQLRIAQQAVAQIRESIVITGTNLEEPGPEISMSTPPSPR